MKVDEADPITVPMELTVRTWRNPRLGFQSFLSVLTQISPFEAILGWKILVRK
jgi:hypothetical protein